MAVCAGQEGHPFDVYETHYAGHAYYTMVWSFDRHRLCTKVL